jgi:hypothetical protein
LKRSKVRRWSRPQPPSAARLSCPAKPLPSSRHPHWSMSSRALAACPWGITAHERTLSIVLTAWRGCQEKCRVKTRHHPPKSPIVQARGAAGFIRPCSQTGRFREPARRPQRHFTSASSPAVSTPAWLCRLSFHASPAVAHCCARDASRSRREVDTSVNSPAIETIRSGRSSAV